MLAVQALFRASTKGLEDQRNFDTLTIVYLVPVFMLEVCGNSGRLPYITSIQRTPCLPPYSVAGSPQTGWRGWSRSRSLPSPWSLCLILKSGPGFTHKDIKKCLVTPWRLVLICICFCNHLPILLFLSYMYIWAKSMIFPSKLKWKKQWNIS